LSGTGKMGFGVSGAGFFTVTDGAEACPGEGESEKVKGERISHNAIYPNSTFLIIFDITKNKLGTIIRILDN